MISHGIEISIAGGGADEKEEENRGLFSSFFIIFLYHMIGCLRYKKSRGAQAIA